MNEMTEWLSRKQKKCACVLKMIEHYNKVHVCLKLFSDKRLVFSDNSTLL